MRDPDGMEHKARRSPGERVGRYLSLLVLSQARLKAWRKLGHVMGVPFLRAAWRRGQVERTELVAGACEVLHVDFDSLKQSAHESDDPVMIALNKLELVGRW